MKIEGIQKMTLLDFPGHIACTVFTPGCDFRCPFCHNADVVLNGKGEFPEEAFFSFLETRKGKLSGVAVTGGEPLMQQDMARFLGRVKDMGFMVKLDTNGSYPKRLKELVGMGLCDYVAVDVKNSKEKYALTAGLDEKASEELLPRIYESIDYLMGKPCDFEFRTTVVSQLHERADFESIGKWLKGDERFFLQGFVDSGNVLEPGLTACSKEEMEGFLSVLREYIPAADLRGV